MFPVVPDESKLPSFFLPVPVPKAVLESSPEVVSLSILCQFSAHPPLFSSDYGGVTHTHATRCLVVW